MSYLLPTIADFKAQFVRDFPFATPPAVTGVVGATATASINNSGSVTGVVVNTTGSGLPDQPAPSAVIYGGGGIGALLSVTVVSGAVTLISVTNGGYGYTIAPLVYVALGGDNTNTKRVSDFDIARAFNAAEAFNMTRNLSGSQAAFTYAYNLLSAHYLCETLQASMTGLAGKAEWLTSSKTVGNVSEAYQIPPRVLNSPFLSKLSRTTYGAQFLELFSPQLIGNMASFHRPTLP